MPRHPRGQWLAILFVCGAVPSAWSADPPSAKGPVARLVGHKGYVYSVAWSPDGKMLASGGQDGTIRFWQPSTAQEIRCLNAHQDVVMALAWSPDGKMLASGSTRSDEPIRLWNPATGKEIRSVPGHGVEQLSWSPNSTRLASAGVDGLVRLWDAAAGEEIHLLRGHMKSVVWASAWSPDGRTVASAGKDRTLRLWDTDNGKPIWNTGTSLGEVYAVAWSPDSRVLAAGSSRTIMLVEAASGKVIRHMPGHQDMVFSVAWSPDGKLLASGCGDKTVRIWECATGKELRCFSDHAKAVLSVSWSPDGKRLASASFDETVLVWAVAASPDQSTVDLEPAALKSCWTDLADPDPARAHQAIHALVRGKRQSVPFLAEQLKSPSVPDPRHIDRLIADLDSSRFAIRQKAMDDLEALHDLAAVALRKKLADKPPLEVHRRIELLLDRMIDLSPSTLRILRAVTVLEHAGNPKARKLLETLANGPRDARLTQEARASLKRLTGRPSADR